MLFTLRKICPTHWGEHVVHTKGIYPSLRWACHSHWEDHVIHIDRRIASFSGWGELCSQFTSKETCHSHWRKHVFCHSHWGKHVFHLREACCSHWGKHVVHIEGNVVICTEGSMSFIWGKCHSNLGEYAVHSKIIVDEGVSREAGSWEKCERA